MGRPFQYPCSEGFGLHVRPLPQAGPRGSHWHFNVSPGLGTGWHIFLGRKDWGISVCYLERKTFRIPFGVPCTSTLTNLEMGEGSTRFGFPGRRSDPLEDTQSASKKGPCALFKVLSFGTPGGVEARSLISC